MKFRIPYLLFFIFGTLTANSREFPEKGVPLLKNYTPAQYQNKGKIWDIGSAPNGIVYMAADKGLLEFDGKTWNSYRGSDGFTRSVLVINDSLLYTGSDLDFGVWKRNRFNVFEYTSLYPFRQEALDIIEEFWEIHYLNNTVIFVSSQHFYIYKSQQLTRIAAPDKFTDSFVVNDSLYLTDATQGLFLFDKASLKKVFGYPEGTTWEISGIYHHNNEIKVVTKNFGLYHYSSGNLRPVNNALSEILKTAVVFSFEHIDRDYLAFGTVLKGLIISDRDGNIIHQINRYKGLLSNTILCLHYSNSGILWLGNDYGVSSLYLKNNISYFYDYRGDFGTAHTAQVLDDIFYLGTNQGLYRSRWGALNNDIEFTHFELIPGTEGQVWTLTKIDNTLLVGHDRGLFVLRKDQMKHIDQREGVWTITTYKNQLLTGNYNGISIFRQSKNEWAFQKRMELILGSCNQLIIEEDKILWVNIPNFGIIRAVPDANLYPAERLIFRDSIFEGNDPWLVSNNNRIQVLTDKYQYTYDTGNSRFQKEFITVAAPVPENILPGIYQSAPLYPDYDFYPVFNGFALKYLHDTAAESNGSQNLIFRKAIALNNDEKMAFSSDSRLPLRFNNIRIEYIVPNQNNVLYQYKLNYEGRWSPPTSNHTAELIGLKSGDYTLFVNAIVHGSIAGSNAIKFSIAAPWYRTWYAFALYFALLLLAAYLLRWWQKIALKNQKKKLLLKEQNSLRQQAEKHREKVLLLEQECLKAEYNQVKQQLRSKTIELANKAKDNEDKNRLLLSLKEKFDRLEQDPVTSKIRLGEIRRLLNSYLNTDDKTFEIQMDELHQEFFRKLKERFPSLSGNDLRLCAYLRVGLNSKEIADILNIQPSSSYISRSRLRKKLNLRPEEDLYDFLNKI